MQEIIILVGISGSGKTTWCEDFIKENPNYVRVNRDSIRMGITASNNRLLKRDLENLVTKIQHEQIRTCLLEGYSVIIDNTNLKSKTISSLALSFSYLVDMSLRIIEEDVDICKKRVIIRDAIEDVSYIDKQYSNLQTLKEEGFTNGQPICNMAIPVTQDNNLPSCVICDLDGTLSLYGDKNAYDRDFENDELNIPVANILKSYVQEDKHIFFLSGRNSKYRDQTMSFLTKSLFDPERFTLIMRDEKDFRRDSIVKKEMYDKNIYGRYHVDFVIDDRLQVIEECWNSLGLFVLNVNQNNKRF